MSRPRGYANWKPTPETRALMADVQEVLDEYEKHLPLTVRQVFYRLVGQYGYDKTERAYARLCEHVVRARRSQLLRFEDIRDDGTVERVPQVFADEGAFWDGVRNDLKHYTRDRQAGQGVRIELWCEAAGMVPQLQRVAFPFSVPVYSTGGFSSVTVTHEIAKRALAREVPTVFLHVGDYDPSGQSIFDAMSDDAWHFVLQQRYWALKEDYSDEEARAIIGTQDDHPTGPWLLPERVALTAAQVEEHGLPTAPPKKTDTRSRTWVGETCQAEAMPPDLLASTIREAVRGHMDTERYDEEVALEQADEDAITAALEGLGR